MFLILHGWLRTSSRMRVKMSATTWIIIALLAISYYQYSNPDKANAMLSSVWGPVHDFISNKTPIGNNNNQEGTCPDVTENVCGNNGISYKNSCEAALAGVSEVTPGAC